MAASRRSVLIGAAACVAAAPALAAGNVARRSGLSWASGCCSDLDGFAALRGRRLDVAHLYLARRVWSDIAAARLGNIAGRAETIMVSYPLFPDSLNPKANGPGVWRRAANGEFDGYHRTAAASLAGYRRPFIFRPGWEWNNRAFSWSCRDVVDAGAYRAYFQRIVTALRAKHPGCWIDWSCDKEGKTNADVRQWYPGDSYVDFIGPNQYDFWQAILSKADWNKAYNVTRMGGPRGIGVWLEYARDHGKRLSVGEWGLIPPHPASGGDNPVYIQAMLEFFAANAGSIAYETYFNVNTRHYRHRLTDNPKGARRYAEVMASLG